MSLLRFFLTLALVSSVVLASPWQPARTLSSRLYHLSRKHGHANPFARIDIEEKGSGDEEKATESDSTESTESESTEEREATGSDSTESTESESTEEREVPSKRGYMEVARGFKDDIAAVFAKLHEGQNSANSLDGLAEYLKEEEENPASGQAESEKSENRLFDEDMFYMK